MSASDPDQRTAGSLPIAPDAAAAPLQDVGADGRAAVEDHPEGTPTEEQDPQRRQNPHKKYRPADRSLVVAR